jgi:hypothetical protein
MVSVIVVDDIIIFLSSLVSCLRDCAKIECENKCRFGSESCFNFEVMRVSHKGVNTSDELLSWFICSGRHSAFFIFRL